MIIEDNLIPPMWNRAFDIDAVSPSHIIDNLVAEITQRAREFVGSATLYSAAEQTWIESDCPTGANVFHNEWCFIAGQGAILAANHIWVMTKRWHDIIHDLSADFSQAKCEAALVLDSLQQRFPNIFEAKNAVSHGEEFAVAGLRATASGDLRAPGLEASGEVIVIDRLSSPYAYGFTRGGKYVECKFDRAKIYFLNAIVRDIQLISQEIISSLGQSKI